MKLNIRGRRGKRAVSEASSVALIALVTEKIAAAEAKSTPVSAQTSARSTSAYLWGFVKHWCYVLCYKHVYKYNNFGVSQINS